MSLFDGWLWLVLGLPVVGAIVLLLRYFKNNTKVKQIQDWEQKFAWKPVKTDDSGRIWLTHYWRRPVYLPIETDNDGKTTWPWYYQNVVKVEWHLW